MNQRMKELAKQLGYNVNFKPSDDATDREYQVVSNDFAEKFAELIVRDCALTAGLMEHGGRKGIGAQILDNFGVK